MTDKQRLFCEEYVANGYKQAEAYKVAYPEVKDTTAASNAYKLMKKDEIKQYVKEIQKERFEALNITAERIACELSKMAFAEYDENNSATSKLKALDLLSKQLGIQQQKVKAEVENTIIQVSVE